MTKPHMHSCVGPGAKAGTCPDKRRLVCEGNILHAARCPTCDDLNTDRVLFGTGAKEAP